MAAASALSSPALSVQPISRLFGDLGRLAEGPADAYLGHARAMLRMIVADRGLVDSIPLTREPGRYTRTLMFGDGQLSVWALLWPPGVRTCVHDHHCSCCFGVISGAVTERWFQPVDERRAVVTAVARRDPGYVAAMLPSGPNVHQMLNETDEDAVSVHIYGFDHRVHASSILREYEVVEG